MLDISAVGLERIGRFWMLLEGNLGRGGQFRLLRTLPSGRSGAGLDGLTDFGRHFWSYRSGRAISFSELTRVWTI